MPISRRSFLHPHLVRPKLCMCLPTRTQTSLELTSLGAFPPCPTSWNRVLLLVLKFPLSHLGLQGEGCFESRGWGSRCFSSPTSGSVPGQKDYTILLSSSPNRTSLAASTVSVVSPGHSSTLLRGDPRREPRRGTPGHLSDQDTDFQSKPLSSSGSIEVSRKSLVKMSFQEEVLF